MKNVNKEKDAFVQSIVETIYQLPSPKLDESRKIQISSIINVVINGDSVITYLVSDVNISDHLAIYVYILTNNRFIVVTIDTRNEINTYPFFIKEMQKISFKSPEPNIISVEIELSGNKLLGLRYPTNNEKITSFFQCLDQALIKQKQI